MLLLFYLSKDKGKGYNGKKQGIIVNCWNVGVNDRGFFSAKFDNVQKNQSPLTCDSGLMAFLY